MSNFEETTAGQSKEMPAKIVLYGVPKIGKTRFCSNAPDPFFLHIERGIEYLDKKVRATPKLQTYEEVMGWLKHIYESETFKCGTIVVDSLDWFEALAIAAVERENGNVPITSKDHKPYAYGNGTLLVDAKSIRLLKWLDAIYDKKGIKSLLIAHSMVRTLDLPNKDPYSRYELKLSKGFGARVMEWADLVMFADYSFHVSKDGKTSEPKPALFTGGSAAFIGGGRMYLKREIPLNYEALTKEITQ